MRPTDSRPLFRATEAPRLELLLWSSDGEPWAVSFSAGIERFIGFYPRLDGFDSGSALLEYRTAEPAA